MDQNLEAVQAGAGSASAGAMVSALRWGGLVIAGSAFVALCSHVAIPLWFTPVPVTLQPFAVVLLGLLMGPRVAVGAVLAYLAEGAAGMPVFAPNGPGGMLQLLGPTGGYLFSYVVVAPMVSLLWRSGGRSFARGVMVAAAGDAVTLTLGATWLGLWMHHAAMTVLNQAVLPFLPGDVLKVCAAAGIAVAVTRFRKKAS